MQTTINNNAPSALMFTQPEFYRIQVNFKSSNEIHQFDYFYKESVDRVQNDNVVALFKVRPLKVDEVFVLNDLYERTC